jgi:hypothetical protein
MASSAAATCLRLRVSDASRDTFREQTDAHLGASRAGCPHWSSEPHRFFDEVVAICDSALDRELRDAVRGFLTGGGPSSASSLILSNCGVDPDLPPTSLAMEANRDAMEQGERATDRQQRRPPFALPFESLVSTPKPGCSRCQCCQAAHSRIAIPWKPPEARSFPTSSQSQSEPTTRYEIECAVVSFHSSSHDFLLI